MISQAPAGPARNYYPYNMNANRSQGSPPAVADGRVYVCTNAGVLAAQILALRDDGLRDRLTAFKEELERSVEEKDRKLTAELQDDAGAVEEITREGNR